MMATWRELSRDELIARMNRVTQRSPYGRTAVERFNRQVDVRGPDECWPWQGAATRGGYGVLRVGGLDRPMTTQTFAFILNGGTVPDGHHCLHECDNPRCCNPAHIFTGTHRENMNDKVSKGRHPATLGPRMSADTVYAMRERRAAGDKIRVIAEAFGAGYTQTHHAITGKTFKHVGFPEQETQHDGA